MPRAKWAIDPDEPDDLVPFDAYDGPDVKAGVYNMRVRRCGLTVNSSGDDMLKIMVMIDEKRPDKKQYNGAVAWGNQNITAVGAPFLKAFLTSIGVSWSDFINKTVLENGDKNEGTVPIVSIGRVKFVNEPECRVQLKIGSYEGNRQVQIAQWLPAADELDDVEADADDDADDDPFK